MYVTLLNGTNIMAVVFETTTPHRVIRRSVKRWLSIHIPAASTLCTRTRQRSRPIAGIEATIIAPSRDFSEQPAGLSSKSFASPFLA